MSEFWEMVNRPKDAFRRMNRPLSWGLVAATILVVVLINPLLGHVVNGFGASILSVRTLLLILAGAESYLAECAGFYWICRAFGSTVRFSTYLDAWGLTFLPTLICALTLAFTESFFYLFWGNALLGALMSAWFLGLLFWKAILYGIFLREAACLDGKRFWAGFAGCGALVAVLTFLDLAAGLNTPVL